MRLFRKTNRRVVVGIADTHGGHRLGLLNPDTVLIGETDDGDIYEWSPDLTETQRYLWHLYQQNIEEVCAFADGDEVIIFHNGDLTQGDRYGNLIPDITREDQRVIGFFNLLPLVSLPNVEKVRVITGTQVHVPECSEARVAYRLRNDTHKDIQAFHHARAKVSGVPFDVAHHGPYPGSRDWLKKNVAFYYLKDKVYEDRRLGITPARVYLRAHFHEYVPVYLEDIWEGIRYEYALTVLPSFSGMTRHARKVTRSDPTLTNGLVCYEIIDSCLTRIEPFIRTVDLRTEEEI
jgi:hypothetical protein